ncbi:MAG: sigma-70 family RNA polymerase sigma factor [Candidatus Omnitrophica bacterium]|nr:sigma-70 family RNA polymerase sigma factor [Candidatus Omnitrophota bacterium]
MDDLEFVLRCVAKDKLAWDEFVDKYSRLIYKYINNTLTLKCPGRFGPDTQEELYHEVFLSLTRDDFRKLRTFSAKNGASLATWLRQVVINHALDYLRKHKDLISLEEENEEGLALKDFIASGLPCAKEILAQKERVSVLEECIERLGEEEKYFIEMHFNQDINLEELRRFFSVSRGAIDMRKSKIIKRLKECFREKGFLINSA